MKRFVTWADVNYVQNLGSHGFQDGILDLEQTHLDAWERDLEGVWEIAQNRNPTGAGAWIPIQSHPIENGPYED